jgi:two-component system, OmpR family, sensor kinase
MWRGPRSIRHRLTLWYASALGTILLIFAAAAFWLIHREVRQRTDRLLEEAARAFSNELVLEYQTLGTREEAIDESLQGVQFRGVMLGVKHDSGHTALHVAVDAMDEHANHTERDAGRERVRAVVTASLRELAGLQDAWVTLPGGESDVRVHVHSVTLGDGIPTVVVAARDGREDSETLRNVGLAFVSLVLVSLLVAVFGGYALARRVLQPIAAFSHQAQAISAADLSERVPIANPRDELGELGVVINDLLQRLEAAFTRQRQFMADASHELRTPLAIVRNEANIALAIPDRSVKDYRDALGIVERESERLTALVEDLFLMARADGSAHPLRRELLYLDDLLRDVAHAVRSLAELRGVRVTVQAAGDAEYRGDEGLLRRAVLNLVDNAIKHTPADGDVSLLLVATATDWEIRVQDHGPGIPAEHRPFLFDRFYKGTAERTRQSTTLTSGAGLGLSIAKWIVEAHGGRLALESSSAAGSVFLVRLPRK